MNDPIHPIGHGELTGGLVPKKYIHTEEFDLSEIGTLELFTDGYFKVPDEVSIDAWERSYQEVEREDPHKYKQYKSTKSKDDRTIMIVRF